MRSAKVLLVVILTLVTACSTVRKKPSEEIPQIIPPKVSKELANETTTRERELIAVKEEKKESAKQVLHWKAKGISKTTGSPVRHGRNKLYPLSMTFDTVDLYQVVTSILHDVLGKNFTIEGNLKGTVSVSIEGTFSEKELMDFLSFILESANYMVYEREGMIYIKPAMAMPQFIYKKGIYFWLYKPKYISARDVYKVLYKFKSKEGIVEILAGRTILMADNRYRVIKLKALVDLMDVDVFAGYDFRIFKLAYSEPSEVARELDKLLDSIGLRRRENYSFIPIDRLGYLISITSSESIGSKVASLLKMLDSPSSRKEKRVYIYKVQHVPVDKLADTLRKFLTGAGAISKKTRGKKTSNAIVSGNVVVVADPTTNSLLIEATPKDYEKLKNIIAQLDAMPKQVLIEVLIAEVSLDKQFEYGIEWWLRTHAHKYTADTAVTYGLAGAKDKLFGFTYYGIDPDHFWNFLYFLTTTSNVNVLSSPHIIVRDNEKAKIDVGQEVPILTLETVGSTQIQGTSAIDRRVEYRDVGIILEVKPHISSEGYITLEITQETSNPEPNTVSGIDSPVIVKRKVNTTLMVKDGHTVVIGGIIDNRKEVVNKTVPVLGNIPLLGKLFSYKRTSRKRTELIVMLTPHVISSASQADIITGVFKERLKKLINSKKKL